METAAWISSHRTRPEPALLIRPRRWNPQIPSMFPRAFPSDSHALDRPSGEQMVK
jgi:hypothetical protein